jgi:hypothetical protein
VQVHQLSQFRIVFRVSMYTITPPPVYFVLACLVFSIFPKILILSMRCFARLRSHPREQIKVDEQIHQNLTQAAEDDTTQRVGSSASAAAAKEGEPLVVDHSFIDDQATYLS